MKQLTPSQLKQWIDTGHNFLLIDIREEWERELYNIGGLHIAMSDLFSRSGALPKEGDVVLYCEQGIRSVIAIQRLENAGYHNLYNLAGGIKAWKEML